jgi:ribose transport system permease protein
MLRQGSIVAILAAGQFFVIIAAQIDLSVGSTLALSGVLYAFLVKDGFMDPVLAALICIIACMVIGAINGELVAFGIPAFIATLGSMLIVRGLVYVTTNCYPIVGLPPNIKELGRGYILGIPIPAIIMFAIFILVAIVAAKTPFGRYLYAIGGNEDAALLSGIKVNLYRTLAFVVCAGLAGIAGIILTSRLDSGQANSGLQYEFEAIIAVVIGGVSFQGGKGKALGVLIGALFMAMLVNGMTLLNVNSYIQQILKGIVFVLAIGLDVIRNKTKK